MTKGDPISETHPQELRKPTILESLRKEQVHLIKLLEVNQKKIKLLEEHPKGASFTEEW